ncbi:putative RNA-binding Zn ribbon-like protein [Brevibacterium pityocampae]
MSATRYPPFRPGTELAMCFTGTLTERHGDRVERIPVPSRLADWFIANGLDVVACSEADLDRARELREAVHVCGTAAARGEPLPPEAREVINMASINGSASALLTTEGGLGWQLGPGGPVAGALGVVALSAIGIISGARDGRLALCASPTCRAAFFDTSRSRTRKWCDMNTCGNREKKARFLANRGSAGGSSRDT